jgi:hypothetical protein
VRGTIHLLSHSRWAARLNAKPVGDYSPREGAVHSELSQRAYTVFQADVAAVPQMTLRGGYAEDSYTAAPPYDPVDDEPADDYLEAYTFWSLTPEQEAVLIAFLDQIAFRDDSANRELAMQVLEEWWLPNALYRHPDPPT